MCIRDRAANLLRLWSVVWLQRLVRRRLVERSRLAAGVALVGEPGADAGLQKAKADASEECVAPEGSAATIRAGAVAAPKRKVGSGAEEPPAKAVAWLGALSTSPAARPEAAEAVVARVRDFTVKPESGFVFTQCVKFTVKAKCVKCPTSTAYRKP
mgnify:CR=1 FL=1